MKKSIKIFIFLQFVSSFTFGQTVIIQGSIQGIGTDTIFTIRDFNTTKTREPEDTIISNNGIFKYEFRCNEPLLLALYPKKSLSPITIAKLTYTPESKKIYLFVQPNETINIQGVLTKYYMDYSVSGSDICQKICTQHNDNKKIDIEDFKTWLKIDPLIVKNDQVQVQKLLAVQDSLRNIRRYRARHYIRNNPDSDFSAYLIICSGPEIIGEYWNTLTPEVRNGMFKKYLIQIGNKYQNLEGQKDILPGSSAPDFNLKSFQGENFILSKHSGKYIVLDFWATWCSPCIKGLPKMKEYYNKYKADVVFVGIACNEQENRCREFINKNELPWINLLNNENVVPNVSSMYRANPLPTKVIIDPEGKIVAIVKGEGEEFYNSLDKILTKTNTHYSK